VDISPNALRIRAWPHRYSNVALSIAAVFRAKYSLDAVGVTGLIRIAPSDELSRRASCAGRE